MASQDKSTVPLPLSGTEWVWLDAFAARTGRVDRSHAAQDVIWASLFRLQQARKRSESMPEVLDAIGAVRPDLPVTGQATTMLVPIDEALQSFIDAYADRCERRDRVGFVRELFGGGMHLAAESLDAPTLASVFPEAVDPDIGPERLQATVEAETVETIAYLEADPAFMAVTIRVFRARGFVLGHVAIDKPFWDSAKWDHSYYSFADTGLRRPLDGCSHHIAWVHNDEQIWSHPKPLWIRGSGVHQFTFDIPKKALSKELAAEVRRHNAHRRRMPWATAR